MSIADQIEAMRSNQTLKEQLTGIQDLTAAQDEYKKLLEQGLIHKKEYNLAPINILGTSLPGQTTYKIELS